MVEREAGFNASSADSLAEDLDDAGVADGRIDEESALGALLASPHSRMVGGTEFSWCRAVSGGTGITILGLRFSCSLDPSALQLAIDKLQSRHPRLRSRLIWVQGRPALSVSTVPVVKVEVLDAFQKAADSAPGGKEEEQWLRLVEMELNTNDWEEQHHCLDPTPMFVVRLYSLAAVRSVLVLRLHTAVCDRASAATILTELLHNFSNTALPNGSERAIEEENGKGALVAVEDAIPQGKAYKPFWAHGKDIMGYSLGSKRYAWLPFNDAHQPRRSEIVCHTLSVQRTQLLLQMCSAQRSSRLGALSAAGLIATASLKQLGPRIEHHAVVTLVDCRNFLDPVLPDSAVGFYHSAIVNTHQTKEDVDFWELARRCSSALENALRNRKHFTDMGDLNYLMCQAIQFPQFTPDASLRTSLMVLFQEPLVDDMQELKQAVGVEDYVGCSSIHGVGPSIAIFDRIQQGALKSTCVYPSPLHSRAQMTAFVDAMMDTIVCALNLDQ